MPEVTVYDATGAPGGSLELSDAVFGGAPRPALLHQAVVRQLADARQGTHDTKTRGKVARTGAKLYRQKGTGRARQGSKKAPHWRGGGVVFGPHPRGYRQALPRQMRGQALRAALAAKAGAGELVLLDALSMDAPRTKTLAQVLARVAPGASALLVLDGPQPAIQRSARNLPRVTTSTVDNVNAYDILRHNRLVLSVAAARRLEARFGQPAGALDGQPSATPSAPLEAVPPSGGAASSSEAEERGSSDHGR